jgi:hypothetical protein
MWLSKIKTMSEKGSRVGKIVEMGGVIAHAVFESGNEQVVVWDLMRMMALMEGLGS